MQYIVTRQIAVEADSPEEAVAKQATGIAIALNVSPRQPTVQQPIQRPPTPPNPPTK